MNAPETTKSALALRRRLRHREAMAEPSRTRRGGGALLALAMLAGAAIGIVAGQPTIGLLAGFGLGAAVAVLLWLADRRN